MKALKIVKILYPVAQSIVEDVTKAKSATSDGGKKITKAERQEIIFSNLIEAIPAIDKIILEL